MIGPVTYGEIAFAASLLVTLFTASVGFFGRHRRANSVVGRRLIVAGIVALLASAAAFVLASFQDPLTVPLEQQRWVGRTRNLAIFPCMMVPLFVCIPVIERRIRARGGTHDILRDAFGGHAIWSCVTTALLYHVFM